MLLLKKSSLWGCYKPRHVTNQDVLLLVTLRYIEYVSTEVGVSILLHPSINSYRYVEIWAGQHALYTSAHHIGRNQMYHIQKVAVTVPNDSFGF